MTASEPLFDRLGGQDAIDAVVDEFYDRILSDDRVAHHFEDTDVAELRAHQAQFIAAVTGGPVEYDGADMREAHEGMGITDEEFDVVADHLDAALETYDVSENDRQLSFRYRWRIDSAIKTKTRVYDSGCSIFPISA